MILSDKTIKKEITNGNIIISPFDEKYLNPVSVDLTLAPEFKTYTKETKICKWNELPEWVVYNKLFNEYVPGQYKYEDCLDVKVKAETQTLSIPKEGFVLMPGEVYLYAVNERIGVKGNIRAKVEGKSSLGRLGLFVHVTAGFIDPGFEGSLVLELVATRPIKIYPDMKICQIEFARVEGEIEESYDQKAGSKYHGQISVQESLMHKNFE